MPPSPAARAFHSRLDASDLLPCSTSGDAAEAILLQLDVGEGDIVQFPAAFAQALRTPSPDKS
eukprot:6194197-Amphidinium_carterae.1